MKKKTKQLALDKSFSGRVKHLLCDPLWFCGVVLRRKLSKHISNDRRYLKWEYFFAMKKRLNLKNPTTFNEKLQWMKLYDHNPLYTKLVDKADVKGYIAEIMGSDDIIIPTLGVYDTFDEIDFDRLPEQFVLKTTHDSGGVVVCSDRSKLDLEAARKKLEKSLAHDYYLEHREWPYKDVKPRIIAEKFMVDESGYELKDYKFFCFNGEPKMMFIASERPHDTRFDFFDMEFNHLPFTQGHPNADKKIDKPENFEKMIEVSRKLSKGLGQVRVDLYNVNGKIYFGELTFAHFSGNVPFKPAIWDKKVGEWWKLDTEITPPHY